MVLPNIYSGSGNICYLSHMVGPASGCTIQNDGFIHPKFTFSLRRLESLLNYKPNHRHCHSLTYQRNSFTFIITTECPLRGEERTDSRHGGRLRVTGRSVQGRGMMPRTGLWNRIAKKYHMKKNQIKSNNNISST